MDELIGQFKKKMTALIGQKEKKDFLEWPTCEKEKAEDHDAGVAKIEEGGCCPLNLQLGHRKGIFRRIEAKLKLIFKHKI